MRMAAALRKPLQAAATRRSLRRQMPWRCPKTARTPTPKPSASVRNMPADALALFFFRAIGERQRAWLGGA